MQTEIRNTAPKTTNTTKSPKRLTFLHHNMFARLFKKPASFALSPLKFHANTSAPRSISMLLANRTGTSSSALVQKQLQTPTTMHHNTLKNTDEYSSLSVSPLQSIIQVITRRFLKVNFKSSQLKKKRKFGFKARLKTNGGRKLIARKRSKGRKYLSH